MAKVTYLPDAEIVQQISRVSQSIGDRRFRKAIGLPEVTLVVTKQLTAFSGVGFSGFFETKHVQQPPQCRSNRWDMAQTRLITLAPREVSMDESVNCAVIDRSSAYPSTVVLNRKNVLMKRCGGVAASAKVCNVVSKHWSNRI